MRKQLQTFIGLLPIEVLQDAIIPANEVPVMRIWTHKLPLRMQGTLVTSIRGCDVSNKEDMSKSLTRMIRRAILNPHDTRETLNAAGFFGFNKNTLEKDLIAFFHSLDQYPLHYITHLTHACEIIGYYHPEMIYRSFFETVYLMICKTLHFNPETKDQQLARLNEDRVANGTTCENFPEEKPAPRRTVQNYQS